MSWAGTNEKDSEIATVKHDKVSFNGFHDTTDITTVLPTKAGHFLALNGFLVGLDGSTPWPLTRIRP